MALFDGLFGGFSPSMPTDSAMPMAINAEGAAGQSPFAGLMGGGQGGLFGQGGGLLGLGFGGPSNKPLFDLGGQGSGLLGFGSPSQMNPMMQYGLGLAGVKMPQMPMMQSREIGRPTNNDLTYDRQMFAPLPQGYSFRGGFASPMSRA